MVSLNDHRAYGPTIMSVVGHHALGISCSDSQFERVNIQQGWIALGNLLIQGFASKQASIRKRDVSRTAAPFESGMNTNPCSRRIQAHWIEIGSPAHSGVEEQRKEYARHCWHRMNAPQIV